MGVQKNTTTRTIHYTNNIATFSMYIYGSAYRVRENYVANAYVAESSTHNTIEVIYHLAIN